MYLLIERIPWMLQKLIKRKLEESSRYLFGSLIGVYSDLGTFLSLLFRCALRVKFRFTNTYILKNWCVSHLLQKVKLFVLGEDAVLLACFLRQRRNGVRTGEGHYWLQKLSRPAQMPHWEYCAPVVAPAWLPTSIILSLSYVLCFLHQNLFLFLRGFSW